jgi:hypothetical protein
VTVTVTMTVNVTVTVTVTVTGPYTLSEEQANNSDGSHGRGSSREGLPESQGGNGDLQAG